MPVPEVYGSCRDQDETFICMQLVDGIALEDAWPGMVVDEK
jgi:aminoglycoside phosphotransferase (APT) family kinase protein